MVVMCQCLMPLGMSGISRICGMSGISRVSRIAVLGSFDPSHPRVVSRPRAVGLQGSGERAGGACEPLVYVGHRVARFFRTAAGACSHGGGLRESLGWWAGLCAVLAAGAGMVQARNADRSWATLGSRLARSAARAPRFICAHVQLAWSAFEDVGTARRLLGRVGGDELELGVRHAPVVEGPGALFLANGAICSYLFTL